MKYIYTNNSVDLFNICNVVLDLDNTIIYEYSYLKEVLKEVLENKNQVTKALYILKQYGHNSIYHKLSSYYNNIDVQALVNKHRNVVVNYEPQYLEWVKPVFSVLSKQTIIRIVTNGNPKHQRSKIKQIDLLQKFDYLDIVYASEYQPKPHPCSFHKLKSIDMSKPSIYIGDSKVDEQYAKNLNIEFLDVTRINK